MTNTPTLPTSKEAETELLPELWALCYLHDWDPPKEGQEHRWEPGKNVFPEIHAFYRTWQEAEAIKRDMGAGANKYWVVRARPENGARLRRAITAPAGDGVPGMVELREAYEAAKYVPGDFPIWPAKIDTLMKVVGAMLSASIAGEPK